MQVEWCRQIVDRTYDTVRFETPRLVFATHTIPNTRPDQSRCDAFGSGEKKGTGPKRIPNRSFSDLCYTVLSTVALGVDCSCFGRYVGR
jgi:hypothetical protein